MNIDNFQELIDLTVHLAMSDKYLIRKFKEEGNYLIIDTFGDFLILQRDKAKCKAAVPEFTAREF